VLVADDYEPWRRQVDQVIKEHPHWQIAGEALDGVDAIAKARALAPDLILLDVALPELNGIDAARQILASDPAALILFMSEHRSWDIVSAAMLTGARGYIAKVAVGQELLPAMDAIVDGRRVVSDILLEPVFTKTPREQSKPDECRHQAGMYPDEAILLEAYARFAGSALEAGRGAVVVASSARLERIHHRLLARGIDADGAVREGRYLPSDLDGTLSTFRAGRRIDDARFRTAATSLIMRTAGAVVGDRPHVSVIGDATLTVLREAGVDEAIRLERLWHGLCRTYNIDVLCGYLTTDPGHDEDEAILQRLCAEHTQIQRR
jgi:DNA-binding NarL/FixJ family response regulator